MIHVAQQSRVLPSYLDYKDDIHVPKEERKLNQGSFGDVWRGSIVRMGDTRYVAVKVLRVLKDTPREVRIYHPYVKWNWPHLYRSQKLFAEAVNCWSLSHPNVLPLLGVTYKFGPLSLVFPWMEHGQAPEYLRKKQAERAEGLTNMSNRWVSKTYGFVW